MRAHYFKFEYSVQRLALDTTAERETIQWQMSQSLVSHIVTKSLKTARCCALLVSRFSAM